jgi:hypothetical protein
MPNFDSEKMAIKMEQDIRTKEYDSKIKCLKLRKNWRGKEVWVHKTLFLSGGTFWWADPEDEAVYSETEEIKNYTITVLDSKVHLKNERREFKIELKEMNPHLINGVYPLAYPE